ncbi:MAG: c-type cytochrome [Bacteroidetes bacterium]|nr:c-type cytochrome [Bacteroidota bacterium]
MKTFFSFPKIIPAILACILCLFIFFTSCFKEKELKVNGSPAQPKLPAQPYQYFNGDNDLATLGRVLFYDRNLSLNNSISCGSCHKQAFAFADNHQFSKGLDNGLTGRNASTVLSSPEHNKFWDGRAANFDTAVFMPVMNKLEMHVFDLTILPPKLSMVSYYPDLFTKAYGTSEINVYRIRHALAAFAANLYSNNSKWDLQWQGIPLSPLEQQGLTVFEGKGRCYSCHNGGDFNGYVSDYENIGLEVIYADKGRARITGNSTDDGKFAVPTLRNIELTAPYMHDGRYNTLREVIDHYDNAIQDSKNLSWVFRDFPSVDTASVVPPNFSSFPVVKLNLTEDEKKALEAFLKTLTDVSFATDPKFSNPF